MEVVEDISFLNHNKYHSGNICCDVDTLQLFYLLTQTSVVPTKHNHPTNSVKALKATSAFGLGRRR